MGRPRAKRGEGRIDAAIDHLVQYGFAKPQIRKVVNELLKLYGRDGWILLEEGSYRVVLDRLLELEEQTQQDQKQEAVVAIEASPQNGMEVSQVLVEAPNESQSAFERQASPNSSPPLAPNESQSAFERQASPNSSPPLEHVLSLPPAKEPPRARPPCYGWISEESESESEPEDGETVEMMLPSKRKRPSRWDVCSVP